MFRFVKVTVLVITLLVLSAAEAVAGSSVTIPLPISARDAAAMVPASARTVEFLAGIVAGVLLTEFARFAWNWLKTFWAASLNWGTHALRYGSAVALLVCLIFLI